MLTSVNQIEKAPRSLADKHLNHCAFVKSSSTRKLSMVYTRISVFGNILESSSPSSTSELVPRPLPPSSAWRLLWSRGRAAAACRGRAKRSTRVRLYLPHTHPAARSARFFIEREVAWVYSSERGLVRFTKAPKSSSSSSGFIIRMVYIRIGVVGNILRLSSPSSTSKLFSRPLPRDAA